MTGFATLDYFAIPWFFLCWIGYNRCSEGIGATHGNLVGVMLTRRSEWMKQMLARENRIIDVQIVRSLVLYRREFRPRSLRYIESLEIPGNG